MTDLYCIFDDVSSKSKTAKLWIDCLILPDFDEIGQAEREADWALHFDTVQHMIPLFFSTGPTHYAQYALYYIHSMQGMPSSFKTFHERRTHKAP